MRRDGLYRLYPLLALGVFAGATSWLERIAQPPSAPGERSAAAGPDMIVEDFTLQRFDASGRQQHVFSAAEMRHFAAARRTELIEPRLMMLGGEARASARARLGTVSANGESVTLRGDVVFVREARPQHPEATLSTQELTLWPETERAASTAGVRYTEGRSQITAGSFEADQRQNTVQLGGGVRATVIR